MKDSMKSCEHTISEDVVYKEVVVIGNGPSGMVTSFMLAGNVPYLKDIPDDLPIDEMLRARLSNVPKGQSLYETDLIELAEGLEGRSHNPIPLLMDNLLRPCADMGIQADSLIEWKFDIEKQISHIVLGRGPPGGAWATFPAGVRTLSPGAWLALPPHAGAGAARLTARAVAAYCRRYVAACKLQKFFRSGVTVTSVTRLPQPAPRCHNTNCALNAQFCVTGYDTASGSPLRYVCSRVVVACGGGDRPNALAPHLAAHALHTLSHLERAVTLLTTHVPTASVLIVGSGVSAADGVWLSRRARLRVRHVHRAPADALARLDPLAYPDYCQVYKMMCDGPAGNHNNYTPYPEHSIVDITPEPNDPHKLHADHAEDLCLSLKRVKLLNVNTNQITEVKVHLIGVYIGSKPDLFFLQTNYLDCINIKIDCTKCIDQTKISQRKIEEKQCFLKNHWHFIKSMLGQSIQSCKSRYLNYSEINGNTDTKCVLPDCNKRPKDKDSEIIDKCQIIPYSDEEKVKCTCDELSPYSAGLGFGLDPKKPVDGRNNPIAIDKSTHEILNGPEGMYALGPLTADNFMRFIPGGALALVSHMHQNKY
ncbi:oxidative stress-induced growth inhibitor 1-like [Helicoverpa zea]|uniref:oxidative stress-induced growth inhibitor 1-like n=1 Tax=Helicoverpa zea TaxID=7113 RepID=UPI001F567EC4|nr:oxidative stress-induced growth inhibitor 1-like [Helicoverpa zea]XP_047035728.1 oxidative stress-induced growth inhibitor 1-like [Helicoverpa zea]